MRRPYAHLRTSRRSIRPWLVAVLLFVLIGISFLMMNKQPDTAARRPTASTSTAGPLGP